MLNKYEPENLAGKSVIVTGGTTGIGRAAAIRLARAGAKVFTFGRHEAELNAALADIRQAMGDGGAVFGSIADTGDPEQVKRVFAEAEEALGGIDILVNNAALAAESIVETDYAKWQEVVQINLLGYMACAHEAIERMKARGTGHILNIGSLSAKEKSKGSDIYVATKSGIRGFSEALDKQVTELGLKVSLIEPGLVGSDMTAENTPVEEQPEKIANEEMLMAEDLAEAVYYVLTQPRRVNVAMLQIRPRKQEIGG